ncbi:MAG: cob(I)yrinic acid a,c-diamide adenosyltransferase, partial [Coriobacteriales bacterium]
MQAGGLIHVYYGYGKGKTTCALGLALRASGRGYKVVIVQFLKDMVTGELAKFDCLDNVTVIRGKAAPAFIKDMNEEQIEE